MKKLLLTILALLLAFALAACGGTKEEPAPPPEDAQTQEQADPAAEEPTNQYPPEAPFMSITIPDGWQYDEGQSTSSQVYITKIESEYPEQRFQFNTSYGDPKEEAQGDFEFWADTSSPKTVLEETMYGFYTYQRLGFTWDGDTPSVSLYTYWDNHPDEHIKVNCFCIDPEDPIIQEVMQTVSYF